MLNKTMNTSDINKIVHRYLRFFDLIICWVIAFVPDVVFVKWQYKNVFGRKLNLHNPLSFNEKIQWLKLNWRDEKLTICADKFKVRDFVKSRLGEQVLTKLWGVYNKVDDIVLNDLPKSFVMKTNHSSGQYFICKDKNNVDWGHVFDTFRIYMLSNHYHVGREFAYKNIVPKIICEEYLETEGSSLKDYKFYCFNGEPIFINVYFDRFKNPKSNLYDLNWNLLPVKWTYSNFLDKFDKPYCFERMYTIAKKLAQEFIFVRVDLYEMDGKIYFGEMTFYPCNGLDKFNPDSYDFLLGTYLNLPIKKDKV